MNTPYSLDKYSKYIFYPYLLWIECPKTNPNLIYSILFTYRISFVRCLLFRFGLIKFNVLIGEWEHPMEGSRSYLRSLETIIPWDIYDKKKDMDILIPLKLNI